MKYYIIISNDYKKGLLMKKIAVILSTWGFIILGVVADDARDAVRNEILKSVNVVEQARQDAVNELAETVKDVEDARAKREGEPQSEETPQIKAVKAQAITEIEQSTKVLDKTKITAKESIAKAVAEVGKAETEKATLTEIETAKMNAVKTMAKAVSSVEVAKAKTVKVIIEETGKVEISKTKTESKPIANEPVVVAVKKIAVVERVNAGSKVEIVKVSEVSEMIPPKAKIKSSYPTTFIKYDAK